MVHVFMPTICSVTFCLQLHIPTLPSPCSSSVLLMTSCFSDWVSWRGSYLKTRGVLWTVYTLVIFIWLWSCDTYSIIYIVYCLLLLFIIIIVNVYYYSPSDHVITLWWLWWNCLLFVQLYLYKLIVCLLLNCSLHVITIFNAYILLIIPYRRL